MVEQEIKLPFDSVSGAREAVLAAGSILATPRRLIDDRLFDTADGRLGRMGSALRVRRDGDRAFVTVKGPVQPGPHKSREELETVVGDAAVLEAMLASIGFHPVFRSQKFREDYVLGDARLTVDEAPVGVFVEIEGPAEAIARASRLLGRTPADYLVESYPALWRRWCAERGLAPRDMVFDDTLLSGR